MRFSKSKEIHELVRRLLKESDFEVRSRSGHLKLWSKSSKKMLTVPQTPSDHRAVQNFCADVRRLGHCPKR